jgi:deoxyhypusine synthase
MVPDTVVGYMDTTIALPLMTAYLLNRIPARKPKRLYDRREELYKKLADEYAQVRSVK